MFQADLRLFSPSVDLTILRAHLAERIACPGTLWLLDRILANGASHGPAIDGFPGDTLLTPLERPRGLPIGNLTSQFLANLHLDRFDHTIAALPGVGASFVGFHVLPGRVRVRNHNLLKGRRRLRALARAVAAGHCSPEVARIRVISWNAHLAHGTTWRLRRRLFRDLPFAAGLP